MPENSQLDPLFDDALSDFADQLLGGQDVDSGDSLDSERELADLKGTVRLLSRTMNAGPPDPEMAKRIRANIAAEWEKTMRPVTERQATQTAERSIGWWERIQEIFIGPPAKQQGRWRSPKRQQQGFSFALAGLTVFALVFVLVSGIVPPGGLTGTVIDNSTQIAIGGVIVGVALIVLAWWTQRRG